jgi:cation:H+ antiporter
MAFTLALLVGAAVTIYFSCEFFVNGVEWLGRRFSITETATGTILAAFGTALPESVVTFVAVVFGTSNAERDIGVGAAIGGPLVLSTLAYGIAGLALLGATRPKSRRRQILDLDYRRIGRDQSRFLLIFLGGFALGLFSFPHKPWLGVLFLGAYALYAWRELGGQGSISEADDLAPLKIRPRDSDPSLFWAALQTIAALAIIFAASRLFVAQLDRVGPWLGMAPQRVAVLFSPIATEMPEVMNAIIWIRQGKRNLALANISGAMMIQATVPSAFGLFGTPWRFDRPLIIAAGVTVLAIIVLMLMFRRGRVTGARLAGVSLFYLVFLGILFLG